MRGAGAERPWRWPLGGGGTAIADADLGVEGRGGLDRLLATPGRDAGDPLGLGEDESALDALLWLGLDGDPLITLLHRRAPRRLDGRARGHARLAARVLVRHPVPSHRGDHAARRGGGAARLHGERRGLAGGRVARPGAAGAARRAWRERVSWSLPARHGDGTAIALRGAHRWMLAYAG